MKNMMRLCLGAALLALGSARILADQDLSMAQSGEPKSDRMLEDLWRLDSPVPFWQVSDSRVLLAQDDENCCCLKFSGGSYDILSRRVCRALGGLCVAASYCAPK